MTTINKVLLIGYLGNKPEGFLTNSQSQGAKFRVATTESWNDAQGERRERTMWHRIVCYRGLATTCLEHLDKGRLVCIEGRLQYTSYLDKNNERRFSTDIIADQVAFLDSKRKAESTAEDKAA